jgi:hypothetical protein
LANVISDIYFCRVPITPVHQLDFPTQLDQSNYFSSKVLKSVTDCSYQPRTSVIKVSGYIDDEWLQNVNYGYYINQYQGAEQKFFFFIAQKNYNAKGVTELSIVIDVFQTWMFYTQFKPCMVERKHVENDTIGLNTYPEAFEMGDYISHNRTEITEMKGDMLYCIALTPKGDDTGHIYGKQYSAFVYKMYDKDHIDLLATEINTIVDSGQGDSIAFLFTLPKGFFNWSGDGTTLVGSEVIYRITKNFNWLNATKDFSFNNVSWTPFNNKMYTYPFNFITIKDNRGSNVVLKWELFSNLEDIQFFIDSVFTHNPTFTITPVNYSNRSISLEDSLQTNGYGLCSWNNDNYASWYAQHQNSLVAQSTNALSNYRANNQVSNNDNTNALENRDTSLYKGMINTGGGVVGNLIGGNFGGAIMGGIQGGANAYLDYNQATRNADNSWINSDILNRNTYQNSIRNIMATIQDSKVQPNTAKGDTSSTGLDLARDTVTFFIEQTTIKPEFAQKIDMFFQMFGYQVNSLEVPNVRTRSKWNYLKTVNAVMTGITGGKNVPLEDLKMLEDIFNNGITIWHDESYMYQYNVVNPIVGGV